MVRDNTLVILEDIDDRVDVVVNLVLVFTRDKAVDIVDTGEFGDCHGKVVLGVVVEDHHDAVPRVLVDVQVDDIGLDVDAIQERLKPSGFGGLF